MTKFIAMVWTAFLARAKPVSTRAKPACISTLRNAARRTQARLRACSVWVMSSLAAAFGWRGHLGRPAAAQPDQGGERRRHREGGEADEHAPRRGCAAPAGSAGGPGRDGG